MVTEILRLSKLGSPAYVIWPQVLLPKIGSSSRYPFNQRLHYLFQALDIGSDSTHAYMKRWMEEWMLPALVNTPNNRGFEFNHHQYILRGLNSCFTSKQSDPGKHFSHQRKAKTCRVWWNAQVYKKILQHGLSACHSHSLQWELALSHMISCISCLIRMTLSCHWLTCWYCCQSFTGCHHHRNEFFDFQNHQSETSKVKIIFQGINLILLFQCFL